LEITVDPVRTRDLLKEKVMRKQRQRHLEGERKKRGAESKKSRQMGSVLSRRGGTGGACLITSRANF